MSAEVAKTDSLEKRLTWLDDQRRKDAELLRKFGSQIKAAEDLLGKQGRQLQDLSAELTRLAALAARIQSVDETLAKHRQEVSRQLEAAGARRTEKEKAVEQLRRKDHEDMARGLAELRGEMKTLADLKRSFESRLEEEARQARTVAGIAERLGQVADAQEVQRQAQVEHDDRHKHEGRRAADLQGEVSDLRQRVESVRTSLDSVEDRARQLEIRSAELEAGEAERGETVGAWMEAQNLRMADLERLWGEYTRRFEAFDRRASEVRERIEAFEETHRSLRQLQSEMEKMVGRLERKIAEVGEVSRLNEERQKQDWSAFLAEDHKRWSAYKLGSDEYTQEHNRAHQRLSDELARLEDAALQALHGAIALEDSLQRRMIELMALLREWSGETERRPQRVR